MSYLRIVYHLARADFYERVRRYSFLVMLVMVLFLGYQIAIDNITLSLGHYRGEFNSAWVGALMSLNATFFIGWFGFYLVKGAVAQDRKTGVGQIMAATPLSRTKYLLGKWLSSYAILMSLVIMLALTGIVIQLLQGESWQIELIPYSEPFLYIVFPLMAVVAAIAVFFEAVPFLKGGFGNIIFFIGFISSIPIFMENLTLENRVYEPTGIAIFESDMGKTLREVYPEYDGSFSLGGQSEEITDTFKWNGIDWTSDIALARVTYFGFSILFVFIGALFFDRFDPSRGKLLRKKNGKLMPEAMPLLSNGAIPENTFKPLPTIHLTGLSDNSMGFSFVNVLKAELKLLLKGQRWWWYVAAGGLIIAGLVNATSVTREILLPLAWTWPVLVWSSMGNREVFNNVHQITFSSASPLWRQLPAQWLAGFILAFIMSMGAMLHFVFVGEWAPLLAILSGAIFIPSLALAAGVWSGTSKLFEVIYVCLLYVGPFNRVPAIDFIGTTSSGRPEFFIPLSLALIALAFFGRVRQVRK